MNKYKREKTFGQYMYCMYVYNRLIAHMTCISVLIQIKHVFRVCEDEDELGGSLQVRARDQR